MYRGFLRGFWPVPTGPMESHAGPLSWGKSLRDPARETPSYPLKAEITSSNLVRATKPSQALRGLFSYLGRFTLTIGCVCALASFALRGPKSLQSPPYCRKLGTTSCWTIIPASLPRVVGDDVLLLAATLAEVVACAARVVAMDDLAIVVLPYMVLSLAARTDARGDTVFARLHGRPTR